MPDHLRRVGESRVTTSLEGQVVWAAISSALLWLLLHELGRARRRKNGRGH